MTAPPPASSPDRPPAPLSSADGPPVPASSADGAARPGPAGLPRRGFLATATAAAVSLAASPTRASTLVGRRMRSAARFPAVEPWGRIERVGEGVWALVSTPRNKGPDVGRTLCNGGIVASPDGALVIEGVATLAGAAWLAGQAEQLAGRWPTHAALTHFHGDHTSGTAGYQRGADLPRQVIATAGTRRILAEREAALAPDARNVRRLLLPETLVPDGSPARPLDLGGRTVSLEGRSGHTPSDLVLELDGPPHIVFCGDLLWLGMFPNYVDAIPSQLITHVRALRAKRADVYVSGHGAIGKAADLDPYIALLEDVEAAARKAIQAGTPVKEAAASYAPPASLGEWFMFSPRYPEVAFSAWERELKGI